MFEKSVYFKFCQVSRQSRIHYSSVYLAMVLGMLANVGFSTRACVAKRATRRRFCWRNVGSTHGQQAVINSWSVQTRPWSSKAKIPWRQRLDLSIQNSLLF